MRHRPAGPPLTARLTGAFTRWVLLLGTFLRVRAARLVLAGALTTAVTALVLVLPVVSGLGSGTRSMVLDSSSSTTASPPAGGDSPVVMGVDGGPTASSSFAAASPSATAGDITAAAPATTGAAPGRSASTPETTATADASAAADPAATTAAASSAGAGPRTRSSSGSPSRAPSAGPPPSRPSSAPSAPVGPEPEASVPPAADPAEKPAQEPAEKPAEEPAEVDTEADLLALLDEERADCAPLDTDRSLTSAARAHSKDMRETGLLTPVENGPAGSVARGGTRADDVLADWLDDRSGRAAILDCDLGSVGIGLVEGADGPWWTLLLA